MPLIREAHLDKVVLHIKRCPVCSKKLSFIIDGKTVKRRICANLVDVPELGVAVQSGCWRHAASRQLYCGSCKPTQPTGAIPQKRVIEYRVVQADIARPRRLQYLVECFDPDNEAEVFECLLPRREVLPKLLQEFERGVGWAGGSKESGLPKLLPVAKKKGKKKMSPKKAAEPPVKQTVKKQRARRQHAAVSRKLLLRRAKGKGKNRLRAGCSAPVPSGHKSPEGWLSVGPEDTAASQCSVDKSGKKGLLRAASALWSFHVASSLTSLSCGGASLCN